MAPHIGREGIGPATAIEYAAGATISTLGPGIELPVRLTDQLVLRLSANRLKLAFGSTLRNVRWNMGLRLGAFGGTVDYHPIRDGPVFSLAVKYRF